MLALGKISEIQGAPVIEEVSTLPIGVQQDINNPYLAPYKHFHDQRFLGVFDPINPFELLNQDNQAIDIVKTTIFKFDTNNETGGINNIPFITKQAKATQLQSTFYLQELSDLDANGNPKLRLQYTQIVMLDFFTRNDNKGLVRWPHVSINTLEKVTS